MEGTPPIHGGDYTCLPQQTMLQRLQKLADLTDSLLIVGMLSALSTPAALAAPVTYTLAQTTPPGVDDGYISIGTALWIGGGITAGVVSALTYIFRLFLSSRDKTDSVLYDRIKALEIEVANSREAQARIQAEMVSLLKTSLLQSQEVTSAHTNAVNANTETLRTLTQKVELSIANDQEEHTRILGALGRTIAAYENSAA